MNPADPAGLRPLIAELTPIPNCVQVFKNLSRLPHCLFLDSAMRGDEDARQSASSLINLLGQRGDYTYRELLQPRD